MHARRLRTITPFAALLPMALTVIVAYLGTVLWTFRVSLTSSRTVATRVSLFDPQRGERL